jgi:membrane-bound serine protease (ClpP class)
MDAYLVVAGIAIALFLAELLLPTGGVLAALGVIGLVVAGVLAFESDTSTSEYVGAGLITLAVLSAISFYVVSRKVIAAHRDEPVRGGVADLIGAAGEARSAIDPEGQVWAQGTVWGARLADGAGPVRRGDRVMIEAVDGLTLVVCAEPAAAEQSREGAS